MKFKLISDGTQLGTKLINSETGEMVHGISKLTWEANHDDALTKVTIEFFNIPVEIKTTTNVELFELMPPSYDTMVHTKSFEKEVKVVAEPSESGTVLSHSVKIVDANDNHPIGAAQEMKWVATPDSRMATIKKVKFGQTDW